MSQNIILNVDLHLDGNTLTLSPPQVVIASTPSNSIFQSQHMVVKAFDGSNIHRVSTFVKNKSISNMLENGAIDNPILISTFEFGKMLISFNDII